MALEDNDLFMVQRGKDLYNTTFQRIKETIATGYTGDVVINGVTLTFENGLLVGVA